MARTRYNWGITASSYRRLKKIAQQENTTITDLMHRATQLLLFFRSIRNDPRARLLIERGMETRELVLDFDREFCGKQVTIPQKKSAAFHRIRAARGARSTSP